MAPYPARHRSSCVAPRGRADRGLARARAGAAAGAVFTAVILWCMLVASAATLGRHHQAVASAQDAVGALRPLAGSAAAGLFAAGLVTSAVVALPVLMATTAYVVGAYFGWRRGLSEGIGRARGLRRGPGRVHRAGAGRVPGGDLGDRHAGGSQRDRRARNPIGLVILVRLARDPQVMGPWPVSRRLAIAGWAVAVIVGGFGLLAIPGAAFGALWPVRASAM
jgi:Mn2+/Fe2+ NRAMP family transporter